MWTTSVSNEVPIIGLRGHILNWWKADIIFLLMVCLVCWRYWRVWRSLCRSARQRLVWMSGERLARLWTRVTFSRISSSLFIPEDIDPATGWFLHPLSTPHVSFVIRFSPQVKHYPADLEIPFTVSLRLPQSTVKQKLSRLGNSAPSVPADRPMPFACDQWGLFLDSMEACANLHICSPLFLDISNFGLLCPIGLTQTSTYQRF